MAIKKSDRVKTYEKYNGHCAYCGKEIALKDMQIDHILAKKNGGEDTIENYNPTCRRCNHYKRTSGLENFRDTMKTLHERLMKNYIFKVAVDYGIVELKPFDGRFHFENIESEGKQMCKYCEQKETLLEKEMIADSIIGWDKEMKATELTHYTMSVFMDRGYLRVMDKEDAQCIDGGLKIKLNFCLMCGEDLILRSKLESEGK